MQLLRMDCSKFGLTVPGISNQGSYMEYKNSYIFRWGLLEISF